MRQSTWICPFSEEGAHLVGRPRGLIDGTGQALGEAGLLRDGDVLAIHGDFTALGTDAVAVEVFQRDELIEERVVGTGEVGFVEGDPLVGWCPMWPWPPCPPWPWPPRPPWPPWAEFQFSADGTPTPFPAVVDGEEFETDRIRVRAVEPETELGPEELPSSEVTVNVEELVFTDEEPSLL